MAGNKDNKSSIFRKKSLERVESPEKLNDNLRVTSPGVWLVLGAVIALLIGVVIWGVLGRIESKSPAAVVCREGKGVCYVPEAALEGVIRYKTVTVDGKELGLEPSVLEPQVVSTDMDVYVMLAGRLSVGDIVYPIDISETLEDGVYEGSVLTEELSPMSLFFS